jgi:hypothetical protein
MSAAVRVTTGFARSYIMTPYQSYQVYQAERPKSAAELRRADEQLGHMAESVSRLWRQATRPLTLLRGPYPHQECDALLDASR